MRGEKPKFPSLPLFLRGELSGIFWRVPTWQKRDWGRFKNSVIISLTIPFCFMNPFQEQPVGREGAAFSAFILQEPSHGPGINRKMTKVK
jgi:hypothetical protein